MKKNFTERIMMKVKDSWSIFLIMMVFATPVLYAQESQEREISGKVTDQEGLFIPGVNIVVKGTSNGTITDANGMYSLRVSGQDPVLVFSFVGYTTQEQSVGAQSENATWRDIGAAVGALAGGFLLTSNVQQPVLLFGTLCLIILLFVHMGSFQKMRLLFLRK